MSKPVTRPPIDWERAREALARTRRAIDGIAERDPAEVLAERARMLAALPPPENVAELPDGMLEVLVFGCGGERYAFETRHIAHVTPCVPVTRIHGVPNHVVGIVAIDGEVCAVLDLRTLLQLPVAQILDQHAIIILKSASMEFGVLAEDIQGVMRYPQAALEHRLPSGAAHQAHVSGVAPDGATILDAARLLSDPALVIDQP